MVGLGFYFTHSLTLTITHRKDIPDTQLRSIAFPAFNYRPSGTDGFI
jgi:hypothetical protein